MVKFKAIWEIFWILSFWSKSKFNPSCLAKIAFWLKTKAILKWSAFKLSKKVALGLDFTIIHWKNSILKRRACEESLLSLHTLLPRQRGSIKDLCSQVQEAKRWCEEAEGEDYTKLLWGDWSAYPKFCTKREASQGNPVSNKWEKQMHQVLLDRHCTLVPPQVQHEACRQVDPTKALCHCMS